MIHLTSEEVCNLPMSYICSTDNVSCRNTTVSQGKCFENIPLNKLWLLKESLTNQGLPVQYLHITSGLSQSFKVGGYILGACGWFWNLF